MRRFSSMHGWYGHVQRTRAGLRRVLRVRGNYEATSFSRLRPSPTDRSTCGPISGDAGSLVHRRSLTSLGESAVVRKALSTLTRIRRLRRLPRALVARRAPDTECIQGRSIQDASPFLTCTAGGIALEARGRPRTAKTEVIEEGSRISAHPTRRIFTATASQPGPSQVATILRAFLFCLIST